MRTTLLFVLLILISSSCQQNKDISSINPENWEKRKALNLPTEHLTYGKTYLSAYSQIYQLHEHKTYDLTVTVSLRNISPKDTVFILSSEYCNTHGEKIRDYFSFPIYIKPLETVEIVIDEMDKEGGTGSNFVFEWAAKDSQNLPLFEAVMISTTGQQGLSFLTRGIRIYD